MQKTLSFVQHLGAADRFISQLNARACHQLHVETIGWMRAYFALARRMLEVGPTLGLLSRTDKALLDPIVADWEASAIVERWAACCFLAERLAEVARRRDEAVDEILDAFVGLIFRPLGATPVVVVTRASRRAAA